VSTSTTPAEWFPLFKSRLSLAVQAEEAQRENELADLKFEAGEHWDPKVKADRDARNQPCLTIDLLSGPIKQVTNQQRTARPGIQISPVGGGADLDKAEAWQGIIRRIERLSQATRIYSWAGQHQVKMGRGFWVVRNVEVGEDGEQDIRIEEVDNQHTIYCDPNTKKLDGSDKRWAIRFEDLTHEEYVDRFGESKLAEAINANLLGGLGDTAPDWITSTHCRIAEYYYLEEEKRTRYVYTDGTGQYHSDLEEGSALSEDGKYVRNAKGESREIRRTVKKPRKKVCWKLINGAGEALEEATIPGEFIPVVMVFGERRNIDGKLDFRGLVRMAKSPSQMEDFCESSLMEAITDAKTSPWLAEWDQIAEFKEIWAAGRPPKVLPYKRVTDANGIVPPPQRVPAGVDVTALTLAAQRMQNHVRNVTGNTDLFQEESARQQADSSGRAILARRQQQELGTSDYLENLGDGIVLTAKIIMSMARDGVYDTPRTMRILGVDEKEREIVTHFGQEQAAYAAQLAQQNVKALFDVKVGEFDIAISPGKNYQTSRMEAVEAVGAAIQAYPPIAPKALPILFKNSDWPGAMELAKALEPENQPTVPPEVQHQLQEQMGVIRELQDAIKTDRVKIEGQIEIKQMEFAFQLQMQELKNAGAALVADINARAKGALIDQQAAHEALALENVHRHDAALAASDAGHEERMAQMAHQQALLAADQSQQHALEQGEAGHQQALEQGQQAAALAPEPDGGVS